MRLHAFTAFIAFLVSPPNLFAEPSEGAIVLGFERVETQANGEKLTWVTESYYAENERQFKAVELYVQAQAEQALAKNKDLTVEFIVANYSASKPVSVQALNKAAGSKLPSALKQLQKEIRLDSLVVEASLGSNPSFSALQEHERFYATEITLPNATGQTAEVASSKHSKILTVVRAISSLGVNTFMIYSAVGSDMFTPLAVPALLFYPVSETALQKLAPQYEGLLRRAKSVLSRTAIQTSVSLACISIHVALLSSINVTNFAWLPVTLTSFKDAIATQAWWEMVVRGKPKWLTGEYVSFGLGVIGMTGLLLESAGTELGSYILYGLGLSGTVFWIRHGALETLKKDAIAARDFFVKKYKKTEKAPLNQCGLLRNKVQAHLMSPP